MAQQHQIYMVKIPFKIYINKNKKCQKGGSSRPSKMGGVTKMGGVNL